MASSHFLLGLVGMDGSHGDVFLQAFNASDNFPGLRVDCLSDGTPERMKELAIKHQVRTTFADYTSMEGLVDGVIIAHRDSRLHGDPASYFLSRGIPCFVDKPMAAGAAEVEELFDIAEKSNTRVTSFSVIPHQQSHKLAIENFREGSCGRLIGMTGQCDPECPWHGLHFYGIHLVESMRPFWNSMPTSVVYKGVLGGDRHFEFHWELEGKFCFLRARRSHGEFRLHFSRDEAPITLDDDPYLSSLGMISRFFLDGVPPRQKLAIVEAHQLLDAMQAAWLCQGRHILIW